MIKLNFRNILFFSLLIVVLFLLAALILSLLSINKLKEDIEDGYKAPSFENKVDYEGIMKSGMVGEIKSNDETNDLDENKNELPSVIFGTSGTITNIKSDRIIVDGDGDNFSDKKPRELSILFSDDTTVFVHRDQRIEYRGIDSFQNLKVGDKISIEGAENVRGKTEFVAGIINVLNQ